MDLAPRYPRYIFEERASSVEQLLPIARHRLRKRYSYPALYSAVERGDPIYNQRLLILTYPKQDQLVLESIKKAFLEAGAREVTSVDLTDIGVELHDYSAAEGWREITDRLRPMVEEGVTFNIEADRLRRYLEDDPDLSGYFVGEAAGRVHWQRAAGGNMKGQWLYTTYESLISRGNGYPDELWRLIDEKVLAMFADACEVRVRDPQGTDVSWRVTPDQASLWPSGADIPGHLLGSTIQAIRFARPIEAFLPEARIFFPTFNGVIAGTGNHTGFFPHMRVTIESGMIVRVDGGGRYGELLREVVEKYRDAEYPGFPYKGWAYFNDASIGTNPKSFRNSEGLWNYNDSWTNLPERLRAGVVHFGFGAEHWDSVFLDYARTNRLPTMHFPHIHNYFPTWEIKRRSDGEWIKVIDQGWLTALGDPDVRMASRILGGEHLLEYDWIPAIPGINLPGDYMTDYGNDPVAVIEREVRGEFTAL